MILWMNADRIVVSYGAPMNVLKNTKHRKKNCPSGWIASVICNVMDWIVRHNIASRYAADSRSTDIGSIEKIFLLTEISSTFYKL